MDPLVVNADDLAGPAHRPRRGPRTKELERLPPTARGRARPRVHPAHALHGGLEGLACLQHLASGRYLTACELQETNFAAKSAAARRVRLVRVHF